MSEGTRAEQKLNESQEQLRQNSAEALNDSLRELRSQAREMVQRQEEVTSAMQSREKSEDSSGLRSETSKEQLQSQLTEQREQLKELQESMQKTVLEAEETEPLVADSLYQTFQQTQKDQLDEQLQAQSMLMDRAMPEDALKIAEQSLEQMRKVQEQIESAASDVLGNEIADLQRAASDLQRLREQIGKELGKSNPANRSTSANLEENAAEEANNSDQQADDQRNETSEQAALREEASVESAQQKSEQEAAPNEVAGDSPGSNRPNSASSNDQQMNQQEESQNANNAEANQPDSPSAEEQASQNRSGSRNGQRRQGGLLNQLEQFSQEQSASQERPLTGDAFRQFNETLRDVGQLLEGTEDRALAEGIRQSARQMRSDFKRHSKEPQAELVDKLIATPLDELIDRVGMELLRKRAGETAIVPLDNDPVPPGYDRAVQVYYENLGAGR